MGAPPLGPAPWDRRPANGAQLRAPTGCLMGAVPWRRAGQWVRRLAAWRGPVEGPDWWYWPGVLPGAHLPAAARRQQLAWCGHAPAGCRAGPVGHRLQSCAPWVCRLNPLQPLGAATGSPASALCPPQLGMAGTVLSPRRSLACPVCRRRCGGGPAWMRLLPCSVAPLPLGACAAAWVGGVGGVVGPGSGAAWHPCSPSSSLPFIALPWLCVMAACLSGRFFQLLCRGGRCCCISGQCFVLVGFISCFLLLFLLAVCCFCSA